MRLNEYQARTIAQIARTLAGGSVQVRLFGSRLDDTARGGDIDLLIESPQPIEHPAVLAAQIEARLMLALGERKFDVLLAAPNLREQPIHTLARREGVVL